MPYKDRNFNPRTLGKCFYFVICMISRHWFQTKLRGEENQIIKILSKRGHEKQLT